MIAHIETRCPRDIRFYSMSRQVDSPNYAIWGHEQLMLSFCSPPSYPIPLCIKGCTGIAVAGPHNGVGCSCTRNVVLGWPKDLDNPQYSDCTCAKNLALLCKAWSQASWQLEMPGMRPQPNFAQTNTLPIPVAKCSALLSPHAYANIENGMSGESRKRNMILKPRSTN